MRKKTIKSKIENKIRSEKTSVFLSSDFYGLGSVSSVSKSLNKLIDAGLIKRISKGIYVRVILNPLTGLYRFDDKNGEFGVCQQVLNKLGVKWSPGDAVLDYQSGKSTQIPVRPAIVILSPFSRNIDINLLKGLSK